MFARRHTVLRPASAHSALPSPMRAAAPYAVILAATGIAAAAGSTSGRPAEALGLRGLARSMSEAIAKSPPGVTARVPLDRRAIAAESALIRRLAARLADAEAPVAARGVAPAELLVTDCASPLYRGGAREGDDLHRRLTQILFEMERAAER